MAICIWDVVNKTCMGGIRPVVALCIFPTGVPAIRWPKWFTETGQTITVTGQIHGRLYYYKSSTSNHHAPFPV